MRIFLCFPSCLLAKSMGVYRVVGGFLEGSLDGNGSEKLG